MSRQGKIKEYLWAGRKDREFMMKELETKGDRTHVVFKETSLPEP